MASDEMTWLGVGRFFADVPIETENPTITNTLSANIIFGKGSKNNFTSNDVCMLCNVFITNIGIDML